MSLIMDQDHTDRITTPTRTGLQCYTADAGLPRYAARLATTETFAIKCVKYKKYTVCYVEMYSKSVSQSRTSVNH